MRGSGGAGCLLPPRGTSSLPESVWASEASCLGLRVWSPRPTFQGHNIVHFLGLFVTLTGMPQLII